MFENIMKFFDELKKIGTDSMTEGYQGLKRITDEAREETEKAIKAKAEANKAEAKNLEVLAEIRAEQSKKDIDSIFDDYEALDRVIRRIENSPYKSDELILALRAWFAIFGKHGAFEKATSQKDKTQPITFIEKWLRHEYEGIYEFGDREMKRLSAIINYREKLKRSVHLKNK